MSRTSAVEPNLAAAEEELKCGRLDLL